MLTHTPARAQLVHGLASALSLTLLTLTALAQEAAPTGSITTRPVDNRGSLEGSGLLFTPAEDVLSVTALPLGEGKNAPGVPVQEPTPDLTGGQGISLDGGVATQKLEGETRDERDARLSLGSDTPAADPKHSRGAGELSKTQQEALPGINSLRDAKTGKTEFLWLDDAKFVKGPMVAPDRVKIRWKGRDYTFRPYFAEAGDAGDPDSRRTQEMAGNMMVKPEAAAEAFTKAAALTQSWLEETTELRVATRWEKVNPLKDDSEYYAFIYLGEMPLAERLVAEGWASMSGRKMTGPNGERPSEVMASMQRQAQVARTKGLGLWGWKGAPQKTQFSFGADK